MIADLQRADENELMKQFGAEGRRLWRLARGIDDRRVEPDRDAKTISAETTFESDIRDSRRWRRSCGSCPKRFRRG